MRPLLDEIERGNSIDREFRDFRRFTGDVGGHCDVGCYINARYKVSQCLDPNV